MIEPEALEDLLAALHGRGFRVLGPTVRDGAIVYDDLDSAGDLPIGWTDVQDAGRYRLERRDDEARFGYAVGPHSWKQFLLPPASGSGRQRAPDDGFEVEEEPLEDAAARVHRRARLRAARDRDPGSRASSAARYADRDYAARRKDAFIVAVNCFEPGGTCFCVSMGTGPKAEAGYDLALTEILDGEHRFLVEVGSERGAEVLAELAAAGGAAGRPRRGGSRGRRGGRAHGAAARHHRHPRSAGAQPRAPALGRGRRSRCLTCGNCTLVCPTCFCTSVEDVTDLTGDHAERTRSWDSCFSVDHSYIHGGSIRPSGRSRYRQWLTHKFGTWYDQFDSSGCVGCGRCITWCPVGIDVTEELTAIRASEGARRWRRLRSPPARRAALRRA